MRRPFRRAVLGALAGAACGGAALAVAAVGQAPAPQLPDLRADPPDNQSAAEIYVRPSVGVDNWLVVRFDGYVTNVGPGPLDIEGNPQVPGGMAQRARTGDGWTAVGRPEVRYETTDDHDHFHLQRLMEYSLYSAGPDRAKVAAGSKVGFCLFDSQEVLPDAGPPFYDYSVSRFCQEKDPRATSLRMGVSRGWRDIYSRNLEFQYVDVSGVAPGQYLLGATADPENQIVESDESNPTAFAEARTTVPGVLAAPVRATLDRDAQVPVALGFTAVGSGGGIAIRNRRFRVVAGPANGRLDKAVGEVFAADPAGGGATVRYTPNPGFRGTDSFKYEALSTFGTERLFPGSAPSAAALLVGSGAGVSISGAPPTLVAGTTARLSAALANLEGGVRWSVNGVAGGDATVGTVTPEGLYTAPAVPPAGPVVIRASSVSDPAVGDEVTIAIVRAVAPVPLPAAPPALAARDRSVLPRSALLSLPRVRLTGTNRRVLVAAVVAGRAGRLVMSARDGRRATRACRLHVSRGQRVTCRLALRPGMRPKATRVVAVLRAADGSRAVRRTRAVR